MESTTAIHELGEEQAMKSSSGRGQQAAGAPAAVGAAQHEEEEDEGDDDEELCPLFLQPGHLPKNFATSKALLVAGALVEAQDEVDTRSCGKVRRERRGASKRFDPTQGKKLGGLGKNNKRGQNFKNSSHDLRDEHSSDQSTMESPHTNSSSADMGQIQVFMSMWNVK